MIIDVLIQSLEIPKKYFYQGKKYYKETEAFIKEPYQVTEILKKFLHHHRKDEILFYHEIDGSSLKQMIPIQRFERIENTLYINDKSYIFNLEPYHFVRGSGQLSVTSRGVCVSYSNRMRYERGIENITFLFPFENREGQTKNNIISSKKDT